MDVAADVLLKGAVYALEQCGILLLHHHFLDMLENMRKHSVYAVIEQSARSKPMQTVLVR
jgi:hypothetical protein